MIIFNNTDISLQLCPVKIYFCETIIEHATRNKYHIHTYIHIHLERLGDVYRCK
jgi:hypothetical protein